MAQAKRAMALDQIELMSHFGFDKFAVVGHDRGGRVGHRMALDHPDRVTKLAVLDILPTYDLLHRASGLFTYRARSAAILPGLPFSRTLYRYL